MKEDTQEKILKRMTLIKYISTFSSYIGIIKSFYTKIMAIIAIRIFVRVVVINVCGLSSIPLSSIYSLGYKRRISDTCTKSSEVMDFKVSHIFRLNNHYKFINFGIDSRLKFTFFNINLLLI